MLHSIVFVVVILCAEESLALSPYLDVYPNVTEAVQRDDTSPLYFGLMLSLSGDQQSTGALAGVQAALDDINNRDDLLPGYSLHYTLTDSKCNRTTALDGLFTQLFEPPQGKVALIGSGCSIATEATAEISHYYNVTHISCTSSSTSFDYQANYFQLLPSEVHLARVFYSIIKEYGWRRVAMIVQNKSNFKATIYSLIEMLSDLAPQVMHTQLPVDEFQLGQFKFDSEYRIFLVATTSNLARQLLCQAYKLGMKYPKYVFITYASYMSKWWVTPEDEECSSDNIAEVLQFSLTALYFYTTSGDKLYYDVCYDAVLALADSLHEVSQKMDLGYADSMSSQWWTMSDNRECEQNFHNICRRGSELHSLLNEHLVMVNFTGQSGPVYFDENRIRDTAELLVLQYRTTHTNGTPTSAEGNFSARLRLVPVAYYVEGSNESLEFIGGGRNSIWPSYIPYDGVPIVEIVTVSRTVTIVFLALNSTGFIYAIMCLLFNIVFQKKRLVRLDSPNLNYLIILGSLMIYTSCIAFVTPTRTPSVVSALCMVRAWLATLGCTLIYATVIAKLWRINTIFRNPRIVKKKGGIKDHHLVLIVLGFTLVDVLILVAYIAAEGAITHFSIDTEPNKERPKSIAGELAVETLYMTYTCSTNTLIRQISIGLLYVYTFFLYLCALYYAFRLRKVHVKGLNDAKYIAAFVYVSSIIIAVTFISTLTLSKYINVYASIYSFGFWCVTSTVLGFLFIPKMIRYYKDPEGTTVFSSNNKNHEVTVQSTVKQENSDQVDVLKRRVRELEHELNTQNDTSNVE